ncbi:MarR family winged helix-turn-helix transcriptional regulator [Dactylosporangium sp. CA-092794]|uniref:MarR family winged helix-turn-helix transcriptional regulator n=1 Tax=Dactylosporangium sp. CA-092794 TaxID=3239929 RepID=UPI003D8E553D
MSTMDALVQLSFQIQRILSEVGAEHDLSIVQIRMLGVLRDRQPAMLELGQHLGLDKSSTTGLVSRAEKRGLVQRSPSPYDGRGVLVALTEQGREVVQWGEAEIGRRIAELTGPLSDAERDRLTELAARLVRDVRPGYPIYR